MPKIKQTKDFEIADLIDMGIEDFMLIPKTKWDEKAVIQTIDGSIYMYNKSTDLFDKIF